MARANKGKYVVEREATDELVSNLNLWAIWHWLLANAIWKETTIIWRGKPRVLPPGTVVFSPLELKEKWNLSRSTVRHWLNYLKTTSRLLHEFSHQGSLVTICNWKEMQIINESSSQPIANQWPLMNERTKEQKTLSEHRGRSKGGSTLLEQIYQLYPKREGNTRKKVGMTRLAKESELGNLDRVRSAITNYAAYIRSEGKEGSKWVLQFASFMSQWEEFAAKDPVTELTEEEKLARGIILEITHEGKKYEF